MLLIRSQVADHHSERESAAKPGVREERLAGSIDRLQQLFVELIERCLIIHSTWVGAKTDRTQRRRGHSLKFRMRVNLFRKAPRQLQVFPDARRDAFYAEVAQRKPQPQRSEVAAQRDAVIHIVHGAVALAGFQIFWNKAERPPQHIRLARE